MSTISTSRSRSLSRSSEKITPMPRLATNGNGWAGSIACGVRTGIHIEKLLALRAKVVGWLPGEPTHGALWRAGLPKTALADTAVH